MTVRPPRRVLIARTDALGDALLALPVCAALRRAFPGVRLTFLASAYARDLLAGQSDFDELWAYDAAGDHAGTPGLRRLQDQIRAAEFDAALLIYPDRRVSWAVWRAGVPRRIGTGRRWWSWLYTDRVGHRRSSAERHEADYNLDLVRALGAPAKLEAPRLRVIPGARSWAEKFLRTRGLTAGRRLAILHPGSRGSAANWTPETYGRLAQALGRARVPVLLTGSPAEQPLLRAAAAHCDPRPLLLDEPADLPRLAALLACGAVFVSGSTGPMHIAAALGVPTVSLFPAAGVTGPVRWQPLGGRAVILTPPAGSDVPAIPVDAALQAVLAVLKKRAPQTPARGLRNAKRGLK